MMSAFTSMVMSTASNAWPLAFQFQRSTGDSNLARTSTNVGAKGAHCMVSFQQLRATFLFEMLKMSVLPVNRNLFGTTQYCGVRFMWVVLDHNGTIVMCKLNPAVNA